MILENINYLRESFFLRWVIFSQRWHSPSNACGWLIDFLFRKNQTLKNHLCLMSRDCNRRLNVRKKDRNWLKILMQNKLELTSKGPCWVVCLNFAETLFRTYRVRKKTCKLVNVYIMFISLKYSLRFDFILHYNSSEFQILVIHNVNIMYDTYIISILILCIIHNVNIMYNI